MDTLMPPPLLTEKQAAEYLNTGIRILQKRRVSGDGPRFIKVGSLVRYRRDDLETWLESRTVASTGEADRLDQ